MLQALLAASVQDLCKEIPGLGEVVASARDPYLCLRQREQASRVYVKDRYKKEVQPRGDPDCRLGVKKGSNQDKAEDEHTSQPAPAQSRQEPATAKSRRGRTSQPAKDTKPDGKKDGKECLWGYGSGVASATVAGYGDVVLAEYTQPFNENDMSYFVPLYIRTVAALSRFPIHITADAAFDARSRLPNGGAAWGHRGHPAQHARPSRESV